MTTTSSSSKPIRHSKILSGSLELSDAEINGQVSSANHNHSHHHHHHNQHKSSKKHLNKTLIDTSQFDSKSFIHRSDGFNQRSLNFGISKSDKSLEKAGHKNSTQNVVPILIVSKSKKIINKYNQQIDSAKKSKLNYIKSLNQELKLPSNKFSPSDLVTTQTNSQYFTERDDYNYQSPKQVNNKINHFKNKSKVSWVNSLISCCYWSVYSCNVSLDNNKIVLLLLSNICKILLTFYYCLLSYGSFYYLKKILIVKVIEHLILIK